MYRLDVDHAEAADVPRLVEIRYAAFATQAPSAYSPEEVDNLLGDIDDAELREMVDNDQLFVARVGSEIVGLAGWKDASLRHVYVHPDWTRRGIASRLLDRVETDFHARTGAREIKAGVALHAEPFYLANGYELIQRARAWDNSEYLEMLKNVRS